MHLNCQYPVEPGFYPSTKPNEKFPTKAFPTKAEVNGLYFCGPSCYVNRAVIRPQDVTNPIAASERMNFIPPDVTPSKGEGVTELYTIQLRSGEFKLDLVFTEPIKDNPKGIIAKQFFGES